MKNHTEEETPWEFSLLLHKYFLVIYCVSHPAIPTHTIIFTINFYCETTTIYHQPLSFIFTTATTADSPSKPLFSTSLQKSQTSAKPKLQTTTITTSTEHTHLNHFIFLSKPSPSKPEPPFLESTLWLNLCHHRVILSSWKTAVKPQHQKSH